VMAPYAGSFESTSAPADFVEIFLIYLTHGECD